MKLHLSSRRKSGSTVVSICRGGCSLREAASGYAPDRAVTFFRFPERKSPKKGGPDGGGRPRADCSAVLGVWGLAQNSLRALRALRSDSRAKSVDEACCARGPKPLRSSTPPTGPKSNTVVASQLSLSTPRFASARSDRCSSRRCAARRIWCSSPPSDELSSAGLCGARVSAHQQLTSGGCLNAVSAANEVSSARPAKSEQRKAALATRGPRRQGSLLCPLSCRYKKVGRLPGRNPGAASRSEQDHHALAAQTPAPRHCGKDEHTT